MNRHAGSTTILIPDHFAKYGDFESAKGHVTLALGTLDDNIRHTENQIADGTKSKTIVRKLETKSPLLVQRAIYPEITRPWLAHVFLMSSAGGILQGDRLQVTITAESGSAAHVTTQASTKIYKMDRGFATQLINIKALEGSYIEFIPHSIIPFKSSRFYQETNIDVQDGATVVYSDTIAAGRVASGEKFEFDIFELKLTAQTANGAVLFSDNSLIQRSRHGRHDTESFNNILFCNRNLLSTIYIVSAAGAAKQELARELDQTVRSLNENSAKTSGRRESVIGGWSLLPNRGGILVRILSNSIDEIKAVSDSIVHSARAHLL